MPRILIMQRQSECTPHPRGHRLRQPEVLSPRPGRTVCGICGMLSSLRSDQHLELGGADCPGPTRPWFIQQPITSILIEPVAPLADRMCSAANRSDNQQGWRRGQRVSYFGSVVSEPLTNTIKNTNASRREVVAED